jgi:hypothetical protein
MELALSNDQIVNRVKNGGNSFTKEEITLYKVQIKQARAAKKTWLSSLNEEEQLDIVRAAIRNGYQLEGTVSKTMKTCDKFQPVFIRRDLMSSIQAEEDRCMAKLAKLAAKKAELNAIAA